MAGIPARCRICRRNFLFHGIGGRGITVVNSGTSCPYCGGPADIQDATIDQSGRVHLLRSAYDVLTQPGITREDLEIAAAIFRRAQEQRESAAAVAAQLSNEVPPLSPLARLVVPRSAGEVYGLLGLLLTLILWLIQHFDDKASRVPDVVINQIVQQTVFTRTDGGEVVADPRKSTMGYHAPRVTRPGKPDFAPRTARKQPTGAWAKARCRCGSGKRRTECERCK